MAGPWEAFQDSNATQMAQNDAGVVAPARAAVPSTARVWGDAEAQAAGLYEPSGKPWDAFKKNAAPTDRAPLRITVNPVSSRFGEMQPPPNPGAMQRGLDQRGLELTRGPEASPASQMATDMNNLVPAASQGTSPHIENYGGKLVSTETFQDDGGNVLYRDPQTKQIKPTDNSTQVALRDPADGVVKVFQRSDATDEGAITGVSRVLGPGLAAGAVTKRAAISAAPTAVVKASDTFATAKAPYRAFDAIASNTPIAKDEAANLVDRVQGALDAAHYPSEVAKQVHDTVALIAKKGDTTLQQLQYVKRALGKLFSSPDKAIRDGAGVASKEINRIIGETSREAGQHLSRADAIHSTAMAQQDLQRKASIAGLRTGRAGYGGNAVNSMRQVLSPIVQKAIEGKITGFKPNEVAAMREIVEGSKGTNAARFAGQLSPSKGIIQTGTELGTAIAAGAAAGPVGVAAAATLPVIGIVGNKVAALMTGKQIERLNQLVAKRSPAYGEAIKAATDKWERAQIEFANNPSPNRLAAYVSASRALSAGLTKDGVQIASGDLLKSIQGPMKGAADSNEPAVPGSPSQ